MLTKKTAHIIAKNYFENLLMGRWISVSHIENVLPKFKYSSTLSMEKIGASEQGRNIHICTVGSGSKKILIWSQMHGNESTGTKALFDLFNFLQKASDRIVSDILSNCTLKIIPILNPDGAEYYKRENIHKIDLNRDALEQKAIESQLLRNVLDTFKPNFCFNLHDQRTIFGVSGTRNPATISFLAPSVAPTKKITTTRKKTMSVIVAMNRLLQEIIPNHIGRYTDTFYPNATGDHFQKLGYPTILIESGHYKNDYLREKVRSFTFVSILQGLHYISATQSFEEHAAYFHIPNNNETFRDLLCTYPNKPSEGFQFQEILENNSIKFLPKRIVADVSKFFFHKEIHINR